MAPADKGTGKKQDIKITGASTLGSDEVDRMVKDAEQYADEDKKRREAVDVKNQACYSLCSNIRNCGAPMQHVSLQGCLAHP